jgi:glycosyltransferase involved in cell wall biosynthesis
LGFQFIAVGKGNEKGASFSDMSKIYQEADVFCFVPKPWEAFGLVYLEAMATNLPVIAPDDPVRREIVGSAGILIKNPEDTDLLAKAIKEAYYKDWGDKPRMQAEKFSWDSVKKSYRDLFESTT